MLKPFYLSSWAADVIAVISGLNIFSLQGNIFPYICQPTLSTWCHTMQHWLQIKSFWWEQCGANFGMHLQWQTDRLRLWLPMTWEANHCPSWLFDKFIKQNDEHIYAMLSSKQRMQLYLCKGLFLKTLWHIVSSLLTCGHITLS